MHLKRLAERLEQAHPEAIIVVLETDSASAMQALDRVREALPTLRGTNGAVLLLGAPSATLAQLSRSFAAELGPEGLRANALATPNEADEDAAFEAGAFLLSTEASYVTGIMLPIGHRPAFLPR